MSEMTTPPTVTVSDRSCTSGAAEVAGAAISGGSGSPESVAQPARTNRDVAARATIFVFIMPSWATARSSSGRPGLRSHRQLANIYTVPWILTQPHVRCCRTGFSSFNVPSWGSPSLSISTSSPPPFPSPCSAPPPTSINDRPQRPPPGGDGTLWTELDFPIYSPPSCLLSICTDSLYTAPSDLLHKCLDAAETGLRFHYPLYLLCVLLGHDERVVDGERASAGQREYLQHHRHCDVGVNSLEARTTISGEDV